MQLELGMYQLDLDTERTAGFYAERDSVSCPCSCANCRNFAKAIRLLPATVRAFFQQLGVDPAKPTETWGNYAPSGNTVHYGGFYHICGTILNDAEPWVPVDEGGFRLNEQYLLTVEEGYRVFFSNEVHLLDPDFPKPVIQMEIEFILPWVLDDPNPNYVAEAGGRKPK